MSLIPGGTATVSGTFSGGAPTGLSETVDGVSVPISNPIITIMSGNGPTAAGTFSFQFTVPAAGLHAIHVAGGGTYKAAVDFVPPAPPPVTLPPLLAFTGPAGPPTGALALTPVAANTPAGMAQNGSGALLLPSNTYGFATLNGLGTFGDNILELVAANAPQRLDLFIGLRTATDGSGGAGLIFKSGKVQIYNGDPSNPEIAVPATFSDMTVSLVGQTLVINVDGTSISYTGQTFPTSGSIALGSAGTPSPQVQIASLRVLTQAQVAAAQAQSAAAAAVAAAAASAAAASAAASSLASAAASRAQAWAASALPPRAPVPSPSVATKLHSFTLTNWGTAPSAGFARQGVPFVRDHVPPGNAVQIRRASTGAVVDAQFDDVATRPNGSLLFVVMHLRDAQFAAGEARAYEVWTVPGGSFANAGTKVPADLASGHTFQATFKSLLEYGDDTPASSATAAVAAVGAAVGSGSYVADLATHMAVATRREKVHSGTVCEGWTAWGMTTDASGGAPDAHLKVNWHGDLWKNADGSVYAVELAAEPAQDWWSVPGKKRRSYDAALVDGASVIASYPGVQHPYKSRWLTCQQTGTNRGKRQWIGGACPTLSYGIDKQYWVDSGIVPPLSRTNVHASPPFQYSGSYQPGGNFDHRPNIDGTGAYQGRGMVTNQDTFAFQRGTAEDVAVARINAHAGLHVYYHYRSNRLRIRPGDASADAANTIISPIMGIYNNASGAAAASDLFDFTAAGMPIPVHAYADYRTPTAYKDGYTYASGGGGVWSNTTNDASHAVNYSGFMHLLEGERYHLEATLDLATNLMHQGVGNNQFNRPLQIGALAGVAVSGTTTLQYDAIAGLYGQERSCGWGLNLIGAAAAAIPDAHIAAGMLKRWNRQQGRYLADSLACLPADCITAGAMPQASESADSGYLNAPWMIAFITQGAHQNAAISEDPDIRAWGSFAANSTWNAVRDGCYLAENYRASNKRKLAPYDPTSNPYTTHPLPGYDFTGNISAATGRFTLAVNANNHALSVMPVVNGDAAVFWGPTPPAQPGVTYYVVNFSANTWQFSATPGGAPLVFSTDAVGVTLGMTLASMNNYPVAVNPPFLPGADDYSNIARAAAVYDSRAGGPAATSAALAKIVQFVSGIDQSTWGTWDMAA